MSKFNKKKCLMCKYAVNTSGGYMVHDKSGKTFTLLCDYSGGNKDNECCLYIGEDKKVHDRRGDDYNNCLLFDQGKMNKRRSL